MPLLVIKCRSVESPVYSNFECIAEMEYGRRSDVVFAS